MLNNVYALCMQSFIRDGEGSQKEKCSHLVSFLLNTHLQRGLWRGTIVLEIYHVTKGSFNAVLYLFGAAIGLDLSIIGNNLYHLSTHHTISPLKYLKLPLNTTPNASKAYRTVVNPNLT